MKARVEVACRWSLSRVAIRCPLYGRRIHEYKIAGATMIELERLRQGDASRNKEGDAYLIYQNGVCGEFLVE